MIALWTFLKTGVGKALAALAAIAAVIAYAFLRGRQQGTQTQSDKQTVEQARANQKAAQAEIDTAKAAQEVQGEVAKLPDAPVQAVGAADPGTAAGKLQPWTRD